MAENDDIIFISADGKDYTRFDKKEWEKIRMAVIDTLMSKCAEQKDYVWVYIKSKNTFKKVPLKKWKDGKSYTDKLAILPDGHGCAMYLKGKFYPIPKKYLSDNIGILKEEQRAIIEDISDEKIRDPLHILLNNGAELRESKEDLYIPIENINMQVYRAVEELNKQGRIKMKMCDVERISVNDDMSITLRLVRDKEKSAVVNVLLKDLNYDIVVKSFKLAYWFIHKRYHQDIVEYLWIKMRPNPNK